MSAIAERGRIARFRVLGAEVKRTPLDCCSSRIAGAIVLIGTDARAAAVDAAPSLTLARESSATWKDRRRTADGVLTWASVLPLWLPVWIAGAPSGRVVVAEAPLLPPFPHARHYWTVWTALASQCLIQGGWDGAPLHAPPLGCALRRPPERWQRGSAATGRLHRLPVGAWGNGGVLRGMQVPASPANGHGPNAG